MEKLKTYLHFQNVYGHQSSQGGDILQETPTHKFAWLLNVVILWRHVTN